MRVPQCISSTLVRHSHTLREYVCNDLHYREIIVYFWIPLNQIKLYLSHALKTTNVGRPYSEMLTYKPLTNHAILRKYQQKNINKKKVRAAVNNRGYWYRVNVSMCGGTGVEVIEIIMYMQAGLLKWLCIDNNRVLAAWGVQMVWVARLFSCCCEFVIS